MELNFNEALFNGRNQFLDHLRRSNGVSQAGSTTTTSDRVKRLTLSMARPQEYYFDVNNSIGFAVSRGVTHLELNFYDPRRDQGLVIDPAQGFRLPGVLYHHHQNLHSLKLIWCSFDVARLRNFMSLETLSLGWITITMHDLKELVASCPILNTLRLQFCTVVNALNIEHNNSTLKNLVVENCNIRSDLFILVGPELRKFIYTGKVAKFRIGNQDELVEARLDFGEQLEFKTGVPLCELLEQLINVRVMSVCSVFLQMITFRTRNDRLLDLNVQHLTLNTGLHAHEFLGIKFMLASCPRMNTLDLHIRSGKIFSNYEGPYIMSPTKFWGEPVRVETCLREGLLVLNVHGFRGTFNQMLFIDYIVRYGLCLRSVNLYLPEVFDENLMASVKRKASQLGSGANPRGLEISVLLPPFLVNRTVLPPR